MNVGADGGLDPRIERSRRVIQDAVIAEMAEVGYGALTVEAVARRAGVSKATLYRQWSSKLEIVEAALRMFKADIPVAATGTAVERVTELVTWLANYLSDTDNPASACVPALVSASQYDPAVRAFHHRFSNERRQVLVGMIVDGQRNGEIDPDLDADRMSELLVGPLFYRRLMTDTPFPVADVADLVATVLGRS